MEYILKRIVAYYLRLSTIEKIKKKLVSTFYKCWLSITIIYVENYLDLFSNTDSFRQQAWL